jgi:hypothetical protein
MKNGNKQILEHEKCQQCRGHTLQIDVPVPVFSLTVCEPASVPVPVLMTHRPQLEVRLGLPITNH